MTYLPVQVHVRLPFYSRKKAVLFAPSFYSRSWHIRILFFSPYSKHATTAAVVVSGATSTPAVLNLRCIVEYGYEYA